MSCRALGDTALCGPVPPSLFSAVSAVCCLVFPQSSRLFHAAPLHSRGRCAKHRPPLGPTASARSFRRASPTSLPPQPRMASSRACCRPACVSWHSNFTVCCLQLLRSWRKKMPSPIGTSLLRGSAWLAGPFQTPCVLGLELSALKTEPLSACRSPTYQRLVRADHGARRNAVVCCQIHGFRLLSCLTSAAVISLAQPVMTLWSSRTQGCLQLHQGRPQMELAAFHNVWSVLTAPWQQSLQRLGQHASQGSVQSSLSFVCANLMSWRAAMCRTLQAITFSNLGLSGDTIEIECCPSQPAAFRALMALL